ncbi:hypothetical protein SDC9_175328 [bioreactor metagenome]|uniref:N-sulphoglucosamine sulphohydrolase C-terminal domain-containing protein n=1 Tax=bioreactor metagenome TaxID=1076179 RepID=A0A645GV39_9ZZZZ
MAENTIVILSTEQGWQFSGGKWTNWDIGVHTGLIVKWPGIIDSGSKTDALVQYADITPTLIDIAGGKAKKNLSGKSFLKVLLGKKNSHRKYVYCMHNNVPEGKPYPIRTIINDKYHYIQNLLPDSAYFEKHIEAAAHDESWWKSWKNAGNRSERERFLVDRFYNRPAEELYSVKDDPNQLNNLAGVEEYSKIKRKLNRELAKWMRKQNDPGISVDTSSAYKNKYYHFMK